MSGARTFSAQVVLACGGFLIWFAHFNAVYALNALVCARGFEDAAVLGIGVVPLGIALATVAALGATALVWRRARAQRDGSLEAAADPSERVLRYLAATGAALGAVAIVWTAVPVLMLAPCG